ncbi:MAG: PH domain-containing protein [Acidimicrobiia bacterium]
MAFPRKLLNDEEEVVLDLRPHWIFLGVPTAALVVAVIAGIVVAAVDTHAAVGILVGLLVLVAVLWFLVRYLRWVTTHFVVTTDRLIYRHGVLSKHGIEIPLERVNTVFFRQRLHERLMRYGDLVIESAGEMGRQSFTDVRKPSAVQNEIYRQMEENENRKYDRVGASMSPGRDDSIPSQIRELDELRKQGLLTDDEFARKKQQLLDRM